MRARFLNSVEGGTYWRGIIEELTNQGVEVSDSFAVGEDTYRKRRGRLGKWMTLWSMYLWYPFRILVSPGKSDIHTATTNPFFLPSVLRFRLGKKSHSIMLVYDLFPDAIELSGALRKGSLLSKIIGASTRYALRNCSSTVFLGDLLKKHAESRYGTSKHSFVIHVGADARPFADFPPRSLGQQEKVRIGYCGNLGRAHDSETVFDLFSAGSPSNLEWRFHSFGPKYESLKLQLSKAPNSEKIRLDGPLPGKEWNDFMRQTHIALVTVESGWENVVMPSKTYSAMVAGQAILAICPSKSDLAELVRKHDCGWVVPVGDVDRLRQVLTNEASDCETLQRKRQNAFDAGQNHYNCSVIAKQWKQLFDELVTEVF